MKTQIKLPGLCKSEEEYNELIAFSNQLQDGRTQLGKMFSRKKLRERANASIAAHHEALARNSIWITGYERP